MQLNNHTKGEGMKKVLFVLVMVFCFSCVGFAENLPLHKKDAPQEDGFCATCQDQKGRATFSELSWAPVSNITDMGYGTMRTTFTDGSYITTYDSVKNSLIGIAFANQLNVIIHWTSPNSWDMIYIGR